MWLAAMQQPDFRTINEFRGERMQSLMDELFEAMILKLIEEKYITMENYFLDGTKIEADANKYSFVWKKSKTTLQHIHKLTRLETETETDFQTEITEQNLQNIVNDLKEKIE